MAFEMVEELSVEIQDEPGALAKALRVVSDAGISVRSFCGYAMAGAGNVMIVAEDSKGAKAALKKAGYKKIATCPVVLGIVKDKAGVGASIVDQAREQGINLEYSYATGTGKGQAVIVLNAGKQTKKLARFLSV